MKDNKGEDCDVDGSDLAVLAQRVGSTTLKSNLGVFSSEFGRTDCP
jgi:hypothetical protein